MTRDPWVLYRLTLRSFSGVSTSGVIVEIWDLSPHFYDHVDRVLSLKIRFLVT